MAIANDARDGDDEPLAEEATKPACDAAAVSDVTDDAEGGADAAAGAEVVPLALALDEPAAVLRGVAVTLDDDVPEADDSAVDDCNADAAWVGDVAGAADGVEAADTNPAPVLLALGELDALLAHDAVPLGDGVLVAGKVAVAVSDWDADGGLDTDTEPADVADGGGVSEGDAVAEPELPGLAVP